MPVWSFQERVQSSAQNVSGRTAPPPQTSTQPGSPHSHLSLPRPLPCLDHHLYPLGGGVLSSGSGYTSCLPAQLEVPHLNQVALGKLLSGECRKECLSPQCTPSSVLMRKLLPHWNRALCSQDLGSHPWPMGRSTFPSPSHRPRPQPVSAQGAQNDAQHGHHLHQANRSQCCGPTPSYRSTGGDIGEKCTLCFLVNAIAPQELSRNKLHPVEDRMRCPGVPCRPYTRSF